MKVLKMNPVWSVALFIICFVPLLEETEAIDPCLQEIRNVNSAMRQYRAAIRDVRSSCARENGDCEGARSMVEDALNQLINAHQIMLDVCAGTIPPPPPAQPPTMPGDIVITEFMANPESVTDSNGEWFEIYNPTSTDFDLNGLVVRDDGFDFFTVDATLILPAGGFVVLGNNGDPASNGGVTVNYEYTDFVLANSGDEIEILNGTTSLDRIVYATSLAGTSRELSSNHLNAVDNDDVTKWCDGVTPYGDGDLGTPGSMNDCRL
jgi:hypothetical protein